MAGWEDLCGRPFIPCIVSQQIAIFVQRGNFFRSLAQLLPYDRSPDNAVYHALLDLPK